MRPRTRSKRRTRAFGGTKDPYAPAAEVAALQDELTAASVDWQVTLYGNGFHAFTTPGLAEQNIPGVAYDPQLDQLSWAQAVEFLAATLEQPSPEA